MRRAAWLLPLALALASLGLTLATRDRVAVYCSGFLMGWAAVLWFVIAEDRRRRG